MTKRRRVRCRLYITSLFVLSPVFPPSVKGFFANKPNMKRNHASSVVLSVSKNVRADDSVQVPFQKTKVSSSIRPKGDMAWEPVRHRNVGRQFTSRHIKYVEDRLHGGRRDDKEFTPLKSGTTAESSRGKRKSLTEKIALLLGDVRVDHDDESEFSAQDIADKETVFAKLSDEEKSEASFAVAKLNSSSPDTLVEPILSKSKKGKVLANVLETGQDTMHKYVKSMRQHQVLSAEDESVLGRQIQILNGLEDKRQNLEECLLRYVHS